MRKIVRIKQNGKRIRLCKKHGGTEYSEIQCDCFRAKGLQCISTKQAIRR